MHDEYLRQRAQGRFADRNHHVAVLPPSSRRWARYLLTGCLGLILTLTLPWHLAMAQQSAADDNDGIDNVAGSGGGSTDPSAPGLPNRGASAARPRPSTLSINPSIWTGLRYRASKEFLVDVYAKQKATIRENPYQIPTSDLSGGISAAWLVTGFSLSSAIEVKESFKDYYGPWNGTGFDLRSAVARRITLAPDWSITPALLVGRLWSSTRTRDRWKVEISAPLSVVLDKQWTWEPVIVTVSMQAYVHRRTAQRDWTFNLSSGIRCQVTSATMVGLAFGFEQRQSNVATAEYSRWVLRPKLQIRIAF